MNVKEVPAKAGAAAPPSVERLAYDTTRQAHGFMHYGTLDECGAQICMDRLAVLAAAQPAAALDVERLALTGVNVWGWDLGRARQYAAVFADEYDALSSAAPTPAEGGPS